LAVYREHAPIAELSQRVSCVWTHQRMADGKRPPVIVPDGCTDILWTGSELRVAGPDTRPFVETGALLTSVVGLRFRCGAGGSVWGAPLSALCDARVGLRELWGDDAARLHDALADSDAVLARALLQQAVLARRHAWQPLDPVVAALVTALGRAHSDPDLRTTRIARELGLSERQLQRRCVHAVGYAPKLLARIVRMMRFRDALRRAPERPLSQLAFELGFADQAHLSHESARLFGTSPSQLRQALRTRAVSDFDKTDSAPLCQAERHEREHLSSPAAR
jgi:AraC-like DNA-binding protein